MGILIPILLLSVPHTTNTNAQGLSGRRLIVNYNFEIKFQMVFLSLQVFSLSGKYIKTVGSRGSGQGQLNHPRGITIDDRGFVLVADTGNQRVQIFDPSGKSLLTFGREDGPMMGWPTKPHAKGVNTTYQHVSGPVGVASTCSRAMRGKVFVSYQGDSKIVAYLVQYHK